MLRKILMTNQYLFPILFKCFYEKVEIFTFLSKNDVLRINIYPLDKICQL